jgi:hypothetical protein
MDPVGLALAPDGEVVTGDYAGDRVWGIAPATGVLTPLAGTGVASHGLSLEALDSDLDEPFGVATDAAGDIAVADSANDRVLLVSGRSCTDACPFGLSDMIRGGLYSLLGSAGTVGPGTGVSASGSAAGSVALKDPEGVAFDGRGDLVVSDTGDNRVLLLAASACTSSCPFGIGALSTDSAYLLAGDAAGTPGATGGAEPNSRLLAPVGLAFDTAGDLLIADDGNRLVRLLPNASCSGTCAFGTPVHTAGSLITVAGNGDSGDTGDGGAATAAELTQPIGLTFDGGDLIIADGNGDVVRAVAATGCASDCPFGLATQTGDIYTLAGDGTASGASNGSPATFTSLDLPEAVVTDAHGNLLIGDAGDDSLYEVAAANCSGDCAYGVRSTVAGHIYQVAGTGSLAEPALPAPAPADTLSVGATGLAYDSLGDLFIGDEAHDSVDMVAAMTCSANCPFGLSTTAGDLYPLAGTGTEGDSGDGGPADKAELEAPTSVSVDPAGDVIVTSAEYVRFIARSSCSTDCPFGITPPVTAGDIYTIAGGGMAANLVDGTSATTVNFINALSASTTDARGDLLVTDADENRVVLVAAANCTAACPFGLASLTAGDVYLVAGNPMGTDGSGGDGGPGVGAGLDAPIAVALDAGGDLLISDADNARVRLVADTTCAAACPFGLSRTQAGDIYTVAGDGTVGDSGDGGPATAAELLPGVLSVDPHGDLLLAQYDNDGATPAERVRLIAAATCTSGCPFGLAQTTAGDIYTVAGDGDLAVSGDGGPATAAGLASVTGLAIDPAGDLDIADAQAGQVRAVTATPPATTVSTGTGGGATTDTGATTTPNSGNGTPTRSTSSSTTSPPALTTTVQITFDDQRITLTGPGAGVCTKRASALAVRVASVAIPHSRAARLRFTHAVAVIGRGIRHTRTVLKRLEHGRSRRVTVVSYAPNAVVHALAAKLTLKLSGLGVGTHTLKVTLYYSETVTVHHRRRTRTVSRTVQLAFRVC